MNIEQASKILLGALHCAQRKNPLDYCFDALNLKLEPLDEEDPEQKLVKGYIERTWEGRDSQEEVRQIYRLQRKGEAE